MLAKIVHWAERSYIVIHKLREKSLSWVVSFVVAAVSTLPYELVLDFRGMVAALFVHPSLVMVLMWCVCLFGVAVFVLDKWLVRFIQKHDDSSELKDIMLACADASCFDLESYSYGFIWGQNRTLWVCDDIIEGYRTSQIYLERAQIDSYFRFSGEDEWLNGRYEAFCASSERIRVAELRRNNNDRFMVTGFGRNFSKSDKRIHISLAKTVWSMNQFVWTELFPSGVKSKQEALASIAADTTRGYFPNSFCLHLVVVTSDGKVVMDRISGNKSNDYPYTLAATAGEQVELADFNGGTDYNNKFVDRWIQRAFYEEFGMPEDTFRRVVDADSARVLALVEEGDIYNVSMVTVITLNYSAEDFRRYLAAALILDKEFDSLDFLDLKRIPAELCRHFRRFPGGASDFSNGDYHPSTAMRLFLTYSHFYGICRFKEEFKRAADWV